MYNKHSYNPLYFIFIKKTRVFEILAHRGLKVKDFDIAIDSNGNRLSRIVDIKNRPIALDYAIELCNSLNVSLDYFYKLTPLNIYAPQETWPKYLRAADVTADCYGMIPIREKIEGEPSYKWAIAPAALVNEFKE